MTLCQLLLQATLILPLLAVGGILLAHRNPNIRESISLIASATVFVIVCVLYSALSRGENIEVHWLTVLPGLELAFRIEALGMLFALIASFLWFITTLYAIGYMRGHHEKNQTRFYSFFAISITAVFAIAYAENLFTLFVFYEMLTLCTYPLVTHAGTDKAKAGGRTYLSILLSTSIVFFLLAIIGTWITANSLSFTSGGVFPPGTSSGLLSALLVLYVFGIGKAAMMPFHRWLPAAMVAPTPVSALLHAVAVVKAGVFTLLKVCVLIFGMDTIASLPISQWLAYLAGFGILVASIIAMRQDNLKARLAYSTVSQLGYISLGAFLATSAAITGSAMHIAMHAFGKITLFFCAGAILVAVHKTEVSDMRGLGRKMPFTMAAFFIASLSIIGLPPTGGAWSKWYLVLGTLETEQWLLMGVLMVSSLLNVAYLMIIPVRAFFSTANPVRGELHSVDAEGIQEAPLLSLIALSITALICVVLFFYPQPLFELARSIL